jgi:hypothetical protein
METSSGSSGLVVWVSLTAEATRLAATRPPRTSSSELWLRLLSILWVLVTAPSAPAAMAGHGSSGWKAKCGPQASST